MATSSAKASSINLMDAFSRGSQNHHSGRCNPCGYVISGTLCPKGSECNSCHYHHSDEKLRERAMYKKAKQLQRELPTQHQEAASIRDRGDGQSVPKKKTSGQSDGTPPKKAFESNLVSWTRAPPWRSSSALSHQQGWLPLSTGGQQQIGERSDHRGRARTLNELAAMNEEPFAPQNILMVQQVPVTWCHWEVEHSPALGLSETEAGVAAQIVKILNDAAPTHYTD